LACGIGRSARLGPVERDQFLAFDRGVALHDLHVARKGRHLFLVAHFEGGRIDLDRLILIVVQNPLRRGSASTMTYSQNRYFITRSAEPRPSFLDPKA
jgi:hypothetical protein